MRMWLDAGALIALDKGDALMWSRYTKARDARIPLQTHAGVLAQVWRNPSRQAKLVRALRGMIVIPLDPALGMRTGKLQASAGSDDIVDAALVALCRDGDVVLTSDEDDVLSLAAYAGVDVEIVEV